VGDLLIPGKENGTEVEKVARGDDAFFKFSELDICENASVFPFPFLGFTRSVSEEDLVRLWFLFAKWSDFLREPEEGPVWPPDTSARGFSSDDFFSSDGFFSSDVCFFVGWFFFIGLFFMNSFCVAFSVSGTRSLFLILFQ